MIWKKIKLSPSPSEVQKARFEDIQQHPEKHKHTFDELQECCMLDDAIDSFLMDAHSRFVNLGTNGGVRCDVTSGPCACGAWH